MKRFVPSKYFVPLLVLPFSGVNARIIRQLSIRKSYCNRELDKSVLFSFFAPLPLASSAVLIPFFISWLRGINVGGHNKIKMDALHAIHWRTYESLHRAWSN
jgi:Protein of unknown function (DUF1697)